MKSLMRLLTFAGKEITELRRQPSLILSLMLGPFLILALFGAGFRGNQPQLRVAIVLPAERLNDPGTQRLVEGIKSAFEVVTVTADAAQANRMLAQHQVDMVEIVPADIEQRVLRGEQSAIEFRYDEVDPIAEQWIRYLGYIEVNELNRTILAQSVVKLQESAKQAQPQVTEYRKALDQAAANADSSAQIKQLSPQLADVLLLLAASPLLLSQASADGKSGAQLQQEILGLQNDVRALGEAANNGTLANEKARINRARQELAVAEQTLNTLSKLPPEAVVTPLQQAYVNLRGQTYSMVTFYAPGVIALILQHIAITLAALSLVRERLRGAVELFMVAPVSRAQIIAGKYIGYLLLLGIVALVLIGGLYLPQLPFHLPMPPNLIAFALFVLVFLIAALGLGFVISGMAATDSQAVQFSMLVLFLSIFFSGFFLPLRNFWPPVALVGYLLPLTYSISGFQAALLRGEMPSLVDWVGPAIIAVVCILLTAILWSRHYRRLA
jgi:ABC-2 type transport system permease protein